MAVDTRTPEAVLAARASAMGVEIGRSVAFEALDRSGDSVVVRRRGDPSARHVGCDGSRSAVLRLPGALAQRLA